MSMDEGRRSLCLAFAYGGLTACGLVSWRPVLLFAAAAMEQHLEAVRELRERYLEDRQAGQ